ncbi:hypothetical protein D3C85_1767630 [compost metagenome]
MSFYGSLDDGILRIYSILGQKIREQKISKTSPTISLKTVQNGIYIYEIDCNNGNVTTGKLIKQ